MTTLASLLLDDPGRGQQVLDDQLARPEVGLAMRAIGGRAVQPAAVSGGILRMLELPVGNLALEAWQQHARVTEAKSRTAAAPGTRELLQIGEHRITSSQSATVEAFLGQARVDLLQLTLSVELRVTAVGLLVEEGRVADVRPGQAEGRATLAAGSVTLLSGGLDRVDLSAPSTSALQAPAR